MQYNTHSNATRSHASNMRGMRTYADATLRPGNAFATGPNMNANTKVSEKPLVCVVDDDALIRDSTVRLIRSFGFRVETFASAEEFENSGYLEETACLILDVRMPGMDGLELQYHLSEAGERIPIVFITAHADHEQERRAMLAGAVGFLYKTFSPE